METPNFIIRMFCTGLAQGHDDFSLPLRTKSGREAMGLMRHMAGVLARGRLELITTDNRVVGSLNCWEWDR